VRRAKGWSLIEAIVALAIVSLALGAIYQAFSEAARRTTLMRHYEQALEIAEAKLTEAASGGEQVPGVESGVAARQYRWLRRVEPYSPSDAERAAGVSYLIKVEVHWELDGRQRSIALSTARLGPPW
jgi:general secretion pathway protein I